MRLRLAGGGRRHAGERERQVKYWNVPEPALGKLSLSILYKMNEQEANRILANLGPE